MFLHRYSKLCVSTVLILLQLVLPATIRSKPIAIEELFSESIAEQITLSPDGAYIALIAGEENQRRSLYARELDSGETHSWTLKGPGTTVAGYFWLSNERLFFWVDASSRGARDHFSAQRDSDRFTFLKFDGNNNIIVDPLIDREPMLVLRPNTVASTLVEVHPTTAMPLKTVGSYPDYVRSVKMDLEGHARILLVGEERDERRWVHREADGTQWKELNLPLECKILGFGPGGGAVLVSDYFNRERSGLHRLVLETGKLDDPFFEDPVHDLHSSVQLILDVSRKHPLGIRYQADRETTIWFSQEAQQIQRVLDERHPETINSILGADIRNGRFLFRSYSDRQPSIYRLLDFNQRKITDLWPTRVQIDPAAMASTQPFAFSSRDGLPLRGYLTMPRSGNGPHPTIALVHGGPWARDHWGFDPEVQFLASRGYAILQINYRGSTGFGHRVSEAHKADLEGMNNDIEDGVKWAIDQGHADGKRVGIMGASFGGYAAVYGITFKPGLYRCAVSSVGVFDWPELIGGLKRDRKWTHDTMIEIFGPDYDAALKPLSPIHHVDRIEAPVFIAFGQQDSTVSPIQSKRLINELKKHGHKPVVFSRHWEGHGFIDTKIQFDYYRAVEAFLKANL